MSAASGHARLRLRVGGAGAGPSDLGATGFDLGPDDLAPDKQSEGPRRADVRPSAPSAEDRATGIRRFEVTIDGWAFVVAVESEARALLRERAGQGSAGRQQQGPAVVRAPMPGRVVRIWVAEGATVEAGQRLLAIEAMKMENEVRAPRAGIVVSIGVAADSSVELGDELLTVR